jgi:hypothetical protein
MSTPAHSCGHSRRALRRANLISAYIELGGFTMYHVLQKLSSHTEGWG